MERGGGGAEGFGDTSLQVELHLTVPWRVALSEIFLSEK